MFKRALTATAATFLFFSIAVRAQVSMPSAQQSQATESQEMSQEKRSLVKELVDVLNVKKSAKDVLEVMEDQIHKQTTEMTWQALSQMKEMKELSETERQHLQDEIKKSADTAHKRFLELFNQRIDFGQLTEDVSISVYGKYFNEKELKDLIEFYKSDTGKRSMELTPSLLAESMSQTSQRLAPVMEDIIRDLSSDATNKFRNEVAALAKAHHGQTRPRQKRRWRNNYWQTGSLVIEI